jgi:excisionase family DNA binding protein
MYEAVVRAEQIAPMLDCSTKTVLRMAKAGQIPAVQIGKLWRFRKSAIDAWLKARLQNIGTYHAGKLDFAGHPRDAQEVNH